MRRIIISALSLFVILPAAGNARLPVVNIASGAVSARTAFGEDITPAQKMPNTANAKSTRKKTVVARTTTPTKTTAIDAGQTIVAANDVLSPRRPSNDLWAKNDAALRMPLPSEFSVIRNDNILPEENIDSTPVRVATTTKSVAPRVAETKSASPALSEIDAQIARLTELQRKADESVRTVAPRVIAAPIAETKTVESKPVLVADSVPAKKSDTESVSLRRLVVPMDEPDVIVRSVQKNESPRIVAVREDMTKMSPSELRKAFRKTFLSENKHLSTFQIDDRFDVASDMSSTIEGFTAKRDLSEGSGIRPLEIKIKFRNDDSALSRENYNLLTEFAGIVVNKPTRAIQVAIPQRATTNKDNRKMAARRLAIVEQVLRDNGVSEQRIVPVLSQREEEGFVLRIISSDQYDTLTQKKRDIFGDTVGNKTYKSMSW